MTDIPSVSGSFFGKDAPMLDEEFLRLFELLAKKRMGFLLSDAEKHECSLWDAIASEWADDKRD